MILSLSGKGQAAAVPETKRLYRQITYEGIS